LARRLTIAGILGAPVLCALALVAPTGAAAQEAAIPPYDHIMVVIAENHGYDEIIGNPRAPNLNRLAQLYGLASNYYGVVHPSQGNYVAILGGDTFGIHDDDAWYCTPGSDRQYCGSAKDPTFRDYSNHTISERSLVDQLNDHQLSWKGYFESIPAPGSKAVYYPDADSPVLLEPRQLYASKHNGFMSFKSIQTDADLASKLVGFDQLARDLASGAFPNYAHIVPNQCNEMHGLAGPDVPADCQFEDDQGRIARGDAAIGALVLAIQASPLWTAPGNAAIVVTFDEDSGKKFDSNGKEKVQGCCGFDKFSAANFGGGRIPTIVITNHGPRGIVDAAPYNHYSLLHTTEEAFGIHEHLGHAKETAPMAKLFAK
jgi:phospholipase C